MQQKDYDRQMALILKLGPDFDPVEEQIVEHYRLRFEGLSVRQLDWWLAELSRLESLLPMGSHSVRMIELQNEAHRRAQEAK